FRDSLAGVSVPQGRDLAGLSAITQDSGHLGTEPFHVLTDQHIGTQREGDRPFSVFPNGDARNLQECGLFLNAAGISYDQSAVALQGQEVQVANGIDNAHPPRVWLHAPISHARPRARVNGEENRYVPANLLECFNDSSKLFRLID